MFISYINSLRRIKCGYFSLVMRSLGTVALLLALAGLFFYGYGVAAQDPSEDSVSALQVRIDGSISPATADMLQSAIEEARVEGYDVLLISLDTPGGLGQSMREMVRMILNSEVPVAIWVGPPGAQAASAGAFLVAGSSVAAMSPQTSIGAASPVAMGDDEEMPETQAKKIEEDFVSLIRGMAEEKGRNVDWYERAVREADSLSSSEAVEMNVVEMLADSPQDFMRQIGERGLSVNDTTLSFGPEQFHIVEYEPGLRYQIFSWLLHPQIAYLLLLGGIAGLFFELSNPGTMFPGVFGAICLVLGLYAMAVLPISVAGLLLILMSLLLFFMEIAVAAYGLLAVAGVVSLFLGSVMLFDFEYGMAALPWSTILSSVGAISIFMLVVLYLVTKTQLAPRKRTGFEGMYGLTGTVTKWDKQRGQVKVRGEIWRAMSRKSVSIQPESTVKVVDVKGLWLVVDPVEEEE